MAQSDSMLFAAWDKKVPLKEYIQQAAAYYHQKRGRLPTAAFMRHVPEGLTVPGLAIKAHPGLMAQDIVITSTDSVEAAPHTLAKQSKLL